MKKIIKITGFTLIELLVVVAMIGILTTLVMANLNSARERARDTQRKSDVRSVETALRLYYNDRGAYPNSNASYEILGCGTQGIDPCLWGGAWTVGSTTYASTLPSDPISTTTYRYLRNNADSYTLSACLENKSDSAGQSTPDTSWCVSGWMYQVAQ